MDCTAPRALDVAIALQRYFPHGGVQRDALATALECRDRGHRVTLHAQRFDGATPEGIEVRTHLVRGRTNHTRATRFAASWLEAIGDQPSAVTVGFDPLPGLDLHFGASRCYSARIRKERGWWARLTPRYRAFRGLEAAVYGRGAATRILMLNGEEQALFHEEYGTEAERFTPLPPGVSRDRAASPANAVAGRALRREMGIAPGDRLLLFLGSDFHNKGLDRALRAVAALPAPVLRATTLLAVGADDAGGPRRLAAQLGVAERVRVQPGRSDVGALLGAADLLIHPARRELGGLVLLEAMVAGVPTICTAACGFAAHVAKAGAGTVLEAPFRQTQLDQTLAGMLAAPLDALGEAGLVHAARVDLHGMHRRIADEIEAVRLGRRRP
ncbi:glycosyltransferase family 4 protein [Planctomycetota bacterium]|jgi:UDP-glucose:(heptosyl)LPS alpha-1,3-glucosyltransferase|nr:glycosyltransferase family 4 protein [Planctomycetota bacterium]